MKAEPPVVGVTPQKNRKRRAIRQCPNIGPAPATRAQRRPTTVLATTTSPVSDQPRWLPHTQKGIICSTLYFRRMFRTLVEFRPDAPKEHVTRAKETMLLLGLASKVEVVDSLAGDFVHVRGDWLHNLPIGRGAAPDCPLIALESLRTVLIFPGYAIPAVSIIMPTN